ncbi:hypothetical protein HMPREF9474_00920 [ [[Clostridium] symbiosum WAL-14163]|uniref:Polysaccharide biosynthesis protein n=2 Tax=Clostridium symbiosum TaxID=1512 RepID=E7GJ27_CLOS6|nr:hypothetical protein HMPREF9474_00920 [ [[Clostridium] symbiosum WAL-14163]
MRMNNSRTKNTLLIMATSGIRQILTIVLSFVSRTMFIYFLGAEYLGLNGLFSNILSLLSLSEFGIGIAIEFYLYKPLVQQDFKRIKTLINFCKTCYRMVSLVILVVGVCLIPILPNIVNLEQELPVNLYLIYILYLLNTASTYLLFAYKQTLFSANQEQYKIEKINIFFTLIGCLVDIFVLIIFKNYILYLIFKIVVNIVKNLCISLKADKEYPYLRDKGYDKIKKSEFKSFWKDISSVFIFKVGSQLMEATDSIVISTIMGTVIVGYYSNYYLIFSQVLLIYILIVRSFTAGIGNIIVKEKLSHQYEIYKEIEFLTYSINVVFSVLLIQLTNSFIFCWIGKENPQYILSQWIVFVLGINFYLGCSTLTVNIFRETSGKFEIGRNLQLIAGISNIFLSIILGKMYGLIGIFLSTVIVKAFISVGPFVVNIVRTIFNIEGKEVLLSYVKKFAVFILIVGLSWSVNYNFHMRTWIFLILESVMTVIISIAILFIIYNKLPESKNIKKRICAKLKILNK